MKIVVSKKELDFKNENATKEGEFILNDATSVNQLKEHYFEALSKIGDIISIDDTSPDPEVSKLCSRPDTIFAFFHEEPRENVLCRLLQHSLGGLMLMGGFNCRWTFRDSTMNMLTTHKQRDQLQNGLGIAAPHMGIFTPRLNEEVFYLPHEKEKKPSLKSSREDDTFHIVYAGRYIANKGICQLVRSLNIWPCNKTQITLVGNVEPNFHISQSNTLHVTFNSFLKREVAGRNSTVNLVFIPAQKQEVLRGIYWTADCFLYPSFHEDENFALAPREAILCGIPFVVTDFCGLGQLSKAQGGIVSTYPTLGGVRYSLKDLREEVEKVRLWGQKQIMENRDFNVNFVREECSETKSLLSLKLASEELLRKPIDENPVGSWHSKERIERWSSIGPESFKKAISLAGTEPPEGLYVEGTGYASDGWYSEPYFMQAIQSLYTTHNSPPIVRDGCCYRGFWRISLWKAEQAIVEFGFPGPRIKRFDSKQWDILTGSALVGKAGEVEFYPKGEAAKEILQHLVDLGYLVPDELA